MPLPYFKPSSPSKVKPVDNRLFFYIPSEPQEHSHQELSLSTVWQTSHNHQGSVHISRSFSSGQPAKPLRDILDDIVPSDDSPSFCCEAEPPALDKSVTERLGAIQALWEAYDSIVECMDDEIVNEKEGKLLDATATCRKAWA
jgi:hypothetical protein